MQRFSNDAVRFAGIIRWLASRHMDQGAAAGFVERLRCSSCLWPLFTFLTAPFFNPVSRYHEPEADRFALEMTRDHRASALTFVKSQEQNLNVPRPGFWATVWRGTHPTLGERIDFANSYYPLENGAGREVRAFIRGQVSTGPSSSAQAIRR